MSWLLDQLKCRAMTEVMKFLHEDDPERIDKVAKEIASRCRTPTERTVVCAVLTQVSDRVRAYQQART